MMIRAHLADLFIAVSLLAINLLFVFLGLPEYREWHIAAVVLMSVVLFFEVRSLIKRERISDPLYRGLAGMLLFVLRHPIQSDRSTNR